MQRQIVGKKSWPGNQTDQRACVMFPQLLVSRPLQCSTMFAMSIIVVSFRVKFNSSTVCIGAWSQLVCPTPATWLSHIWLLKCSFIWPIPVSATSLFLLIVFRAKGETLSTSDERTPSTPQDKLLVLLRCGCSPEGRGDNREWLF